MSTRVRHPSPEELRARRARLLAEARIDRDELEALAAAGALTGDEFWVWEDVRSIEFLLGDDAPAHADA